MKACDRCLSRGFLLERLAGHLESERARIDELLSLPDAELIVAVGGGRADAIGDELRRTDPEARRVRVAAAGLEAVCRCSPLYPQQLLELRVPPHALYVAGGVQRLASVLAEPAVAIVGARRASPYGVEVARALASGLGGSGVTVVSGMALGIDGVAHDGALRGIRGVSGEGPLHGVGGVAGEGPRRAVGGVDSDGPQCARSATIAVLPGGTDRPYPAAHRRLYNRILAGGIVVSELPPGAAPRRWMFPARNRIIAGLSAMTIVVQARSRSGALVTARHARELGRGLGAVPGAVSSPLSAGPHRLIRDGAQLITDAQDVLDAVYGPGRRKLADVRRAQLSERDAALLDALTEGHEGAAAFARADLGPIEGLEAVAALELAGAIRRAPGGRLVVTTGAG